MIAKFGEDLGCSCRCGIVCDQDWETEDELSEKSCCRGLKMFRMPTSTEWGAKIGERDERSYEERVSILRSRQKYGSDITFRVLETINGFKLPVL
jgi:hypothetical protein